MDLLNGPAMIGRLEPSPSDSGAVYSGSTRGLSTSIPHFQRVVDLDTADNEEDFSRAAYMFLDDDGEKTLEYLEAFYGSLPYRNKQYEAAERTLGRMGPNSDLMAAATCYLARMQYHNG